MDNMEVRALAERLGLRFDEELGLIFGQKEGYNLYITEASQQNQYSIYFSVSLAEGLDGKEVLRDWKDQAKSLLRVDANRYKITCLVKNAMTKNKAANYLEEALEASLNFLTERGFVNVCEQSGEQGQIDVYQVGNQALILSPASFQSLAASHSLDNQEYDNQSEHMVAGIVGAFLGSLIGLIVILLVAQMGYVSVAGGIVMGVCTIKGYELLGKKVSKKGLVISILLMIVMTFVAQQLDSAMELLKANKLGFEYLGEGFQYVNQAVFTNTDVPGQYWFNLALLYLFTAVGAFYMVRNTLFNQSQRYVTRKL
ncbi:ECF transporter S component [Streptococcus oricebi]|uniref:YkoY family integral membrane protein n=1 Tax=Streptococcus oricebi TaxID=1547447 RepID=A0ABS5B2S1_9STRE|nr:ECF transporter S component [Streptococcus oricebi]MBP2623127.1 hypothetical protein [Streptococcus oricebi]